MENVECVQCHSSMKKTKKAETNMTAQIFGVVLFIIGLCLLFVFPIGTVIGLFIMIGAARMGYKQNKVWLCPECGYYFKRA